MQVKLNHGTYDDCKINICKYPNECPAIVIYHDDKVLLKASVNMPDHLIPEGYICIKDWSENEGILQVLIENRIIEPPDFLITLEFVTVQVCKLIEGDKYVN
jgi:hypothetical protein